MEEDKAAAYYDELTRKGEGAARFKRGLGFSSSSSSSFPSSSSSPLTKFVRAASPKRAAQIQKESELEAIHKKLSRESNHRDRRDEYERNRGKRSPSDDERRRRGRDGGRGRSRSPDRDGYGRYRGKRSSSEDESHRGGERSRGRSRSPSHHRRRRICTANVDYSSLIEGYSDMTPAERVKAKMKIQLSQIAAKDTGMGMNTGWERFDFNKDAPLDNEDEIEVAEDDASLVKVIGKSFRFSASEAKREEEVKAAHDEAMFGAPAASSEIVSSEVNDAVIKEINLGNDSLISDKVHKLLLYIVSAWRKEWNLKSIGFRCLQCKKEVGETEHAILAIVEETERSQVEPTTNRNLPIKKECN